MVVVGRARTGRIDRVEAAARPAGGPFGAVQVVSAAGQNADDPAVSIDNSGKAVAAWIRYDVGTSGTGRIQAAVRPAAGSFGAATTISADGQVTFEPQVDTGPAADSEHRRDLDRSDGTNLRVRARGAGT